MSEWRTLGPEDILQEGDEWSEKGKAIWNLVNPTCFGNDIGHWDRCYDFRRRVSPAEQSSEVPTDKESLTAPFCPNCGAIEGQGHTLKCWKQRAEKAEALRGEANAALQWANETLADYRFKLHQAEKERDQLRVEVEEARATAREECKIVCQLRAENERLTKAMNRYSEDEILCENKRLREALIIISQYGRGVATPFENVRNIALQALAAKGETK